MTDQRCRKKPSASGGAKPVLIGAGTAVACMLLIMAAVSLVTLLIKSVTHSSVLPLALAAAGIGCAVGGIVCARIVCARIVCGRIACARGICAGKRRAGMLYGALVGLAVFIVIWLAGLCFSSPVFGTENAVKLIVLVMCGCFGGYAGSVNGLLGSGRR